MFRRRRALSRHMLIGFKYPPFDECCRGECDGVGYLPLFFYPRRGRMVQAQNGRKLTADEVIGWRLAHEANCGPMARVLAFVTLHWRAAFRPCDGWHFVVCPTCRGTGRQS